MINDITDYVEHKFRKGELNEDIEFFKIHMAKYFKSTNSTGYGTILNNLLMAE